MARLVPSILECQQYRPNYFYMKLLSLFVNFIKPINVGVMSGLLLAGTAQAHEKHIHGLHEHIAIPAIGQVLEAKLDTGATTASLSAHKIELFEKDDEQWVRFSLAIDDAPDKAFEMPAVRSSRVKRRAEDFDADEDKTYIERPVVEMDVVLGDRKETIEVNLADRRNFKYPFLLGSKAMKQLGVIVDPDEEFTVTKLEIDDDTD